MQLSLQQTVAPTVYPLSGDLAATMVRADPADPKAAAYLEWLIKNATNWCETKSRKQFCTATWMQKLLNFPPYAPDDFAHPHYLDAFWPYLYPRSTCGTDRLILLAKPPLQSVTSIQYIDGTGATQTLDPSLYLVETGTVPGRVSEAYGTVWPIAREQLGAVTVTFVAGYGTPDQVPGRIQQSIGFLVAHWWANREAAVVGYVSNEVELTLGRALTSFTGAICA